jgi:predicted nucleotidyltransferase
MTPPLTAEQLATYGATMRRRAADDARRRRERRDAAWGVARQAAELLRARHGATSVLAFGSLADGAHFGARSDIDLAAYGLAPSDHYAALGRLLALSPDFEFDLVDLATCRAELRSAILAGGIPL